ncbi:MAG: hypothetical protein HYZ16_11825 [Bacteroidetes bacterium]|nr:hypothetical protein [Bacteroidota bacterium]
MAKSDYIASLIKAHYNSEAERFTTVALQIAAHEAKLGHTLVVNEMEESKLIKTRLLGNALFCGNGLLGIEFLGMIRRLLAINYFIQYFNINNNGQVDRLVKNRPVSGHESQLIILVNPPYGVSHGQSNYRDVWGVGFVGE